MFFSPSVRDIWLYLLSSIKALLLTSLNSMRYCPNTFVVMFSMSRTSGSSIVVRTSHPGRVDILFSYQC